MTTSWVIIRKSDGKAMFETFDPKEVLALNIEQYTAVPILEYLQNLNREIANK